MADDEHLLRARTASANDTRALATAVAGCVRDGDLLVLTGDLGAGKTCFTQGLARGLEIDDRITSPTFALVAEHQGRLDLHHLDVYRLDDAGSALDLDLPELLEAGVTVIEWGERIAEILPADRLTIELRYPPVDPPVDADWREDPAAVPVEDERDLCFSLGGPSWQERADDLADAIGTHPTPC